MNEPHDIPAQTVFNLVWYSPRLNRPALFNPLQNQAAVNGIRASGATSQLILVEGTSWTGAWSEFSYPIVELSRGAHLTVALAWTSSGNSAVFGAIQDPNNNVAIGRHPPTITNFFYLLFT